MCNTESKKTHYFYGMIFSHEPSIGIFFTIILMKAGKRLVRGYTAEPVSKESLLPNGE